jgi:hypothetical protein
MGDRVVYYYLSHQELAYLAWPSSGEVENGPDWYKVGALGFQPLIDTFDHFWWQRFAFLLPTDQRLREREVAEGVVAASVKLTLGKGDHRVEIVLLTFHGTWRNLRCEPHIPPVSSILTGDL